MAKYKSENPSVLEDHLSNGRWDDARTFLRTDEGRKEVEQGLTSYPPPQMNRYGIMEKGRVLVTPALYTAIYHRAPFDIIEMTFNFKPEELDESDMNCALAERRSRDANNPGNVWHAVERETILEFLVERCATRFLVRLSSTGLADGNRWTPLACAVSNEEVSPRIVRMMCFRQPDAIDTKCHLPDNYTAYPIDISIGNREKRNLLLQGSDFYKQHKDTAVGGNKWEKVIIPPLPKEAYEIALTDAMKRKQWFVVSDLYADAEAASADEAVLQKARKGLEKEEAAKRSEAWRNKYLGPAMFPYYVVEDLVKAAKRSVSK
mmetsp:Transcript_7578/g.10305  ORF Transcript_7578/g.10305 Transcript_7578/m.10305 type:complete len:319 (-) Transcript_7578:220-1176(-)